jgi:hypothetical protein
MGLRGTLMTMSTPSKILNASDDNAASCNGWSDCDPATIVKRTDKTIVVQRDRAVHMSGAAHDAHANGAGQVVIFERDYDAPSLTIGHRRSYRDPSF